MSAHLMQTRRRVEKNIVENFAGISSCRRSERGVALGSSDATVAFTSKHLPRCPEETVTMETSPIAPAHGASHFTRTHRVGRILAAGILAALAGFPSASADVIDVDNIVFLPEGGSPPPLVFTANTLTIGPGGFANLKNNKLIVRTGDLATLTGYLVSGYASGPNGYWDGSGINSSTAAADPTHRTGVGIADNSVLHYTSWPFDQPVPLTGGSEILIMYAYYGDANLDGVVDAADLALMGTGSGWMHGDFNYDGVVNATDYALYNAGLQSPGGGVPEPTPPPSSASARSVRSASAAVRRPSVPKPASQLLPRP